MGSLISKVSFIKSLFIIKSNAKSVFTNHVLWVHFLEDTSTDHHNRRLRMILSGDYDCFIITNGIKIFN